VNVFHLRKVAADPLAAKTFAVINPHATSHSFAWSYVPSMRTIVGNWDTSLYSGDFAMDLRATYRRAGALSPSTLTVSSTSFRQTEPAAAR
jgi:hypothetical protein